MSTEEIVNATAVELPASSSVSSLPSFAVSKEEKLVALAVGENIYIYDESLSTQLIHHKLEKSSVKAMLFEGKYFIVAGTEDKAVHVFALDKQLSSLKLIGKIELIKKPNCIAIQPTNKELWIGDKFGDVYIIDLLKVFDLFASTPTIIKKPPPKMGHLAMLTGLIIGERYIITSDRDEKIRVTNYPEYYLVHNFCLGHTEMVSCICLASEDLLVSASTDRTIKVWKHLIDADEALKFSYDCGEQNYPNILQSVTINGVTLVLVLYEQADYIQVLQLNTEEATLTPKCKIQLGSEILNFHTSTTNSQDGKAWIHLFTSSSPNIHVVSLSAGGEELKYETTSSQLQVSFNKEDLVLDNIYSSLIRKIDQSSSSNNKNDQSEEKQSKKQKNKK